jgi:hypothetical protein
VDWDPLHIFQLKMNPDKMIKTELCNPPGEAIRSSGDTAGGEHPLQTNGLNSRIFSTQDMTRVKTEVTTKDMTGDMINALVLGILGYGKDE